MNKWYCLIGVLAILALSMTASAKDLQTSIAIAETEGPLVGTVTVGGQGAAGSPGEVMYRNDGWSGSYCYVEYYGPAVQFDDIYLPSGKTTTLWSYTLYGYGAAAAPYDVETSMWTDICEDPCGLCGVPVAPIPNTDCLFVGLPNGVLQLECDVEAFAPMLPPAFWLVYDPVLHNGDVCGWIISDTSDGMGPVDKGFSCDMFAEEAPAGSGTFYFWYFGPGCVPTGGGTSCANMVTQFVGPGDPWACCDPSDYSCVNILESECDPYTKIFTQGVLCNDLDPPCSESGACCDTLTGVCTNSFESLCDGYLEVFFPGQDCSSVECEEPIGVPTVTQWGMFVLVGILLAGLTIKFGRRQRVTA